MLNYSVAELRNKRNETRMVVSVTIPYDNHIFKCNGEIAKTI